MSKEAIIIPHHLQSYINECLDDTELKALRAIPVKIFDFIVNLREYYNFERREFRNYKDRILTVEDIKSLSKEEIAYYKRVRDSKLDKYYPDVLSQPIGSAATAAAAAEKPLPDHQELVRFLRSSRQAQLHASASSPARLFDISDGTLAACTSPIQDTSVSSKEQQRMPAHTRIKLNKKDKKLKTAAPSTSPASLAASAATISPSQKQPPALTTLFRGKLSTSTSTTNIDASTPRSDEKTPLLQRHPTK